MSPQPASVDWDQLRTAATDASRHAYAPYSGFPVGAAALVDDGRMGRRSAPSADWYRRFMPAAVDG
jgi:hypothetical protein